MEVVHENLVAHGTLKAMNGAEPKWLVVHFPAPRVPLSQVH
jgi:hypothetical protein